MNVEIAQSCPHVVGHQVHLAGERVQRSRQFALKGGTQVVGVAARLFHCGSPFGVDQIEHDQPKQRDD